MRARTPGQPDQWYQVALELKESGSLIGDCAFHLSKDSRQAEIGMTLASSFQNRGYAAEAGEWLLRAMRSVEKLGFRREGLFLKSLWLKDEWVDEVWYTLLREEWLAER